MEGDKRSSYVTLPKNFKFASKINSVPLAVTEFEMACRSYPIVFSSGETVAPVSIVGLREEENLFLDEESAWLSNIYVPAYIRKYPFIPKFRRRLIFVKISMPPGSKRRVLLASCLIMIFCSRSALTLRFLQVLNFHLAVLA
jgi:hypothetical protein